MIHWRLFRHIPIFSGFGEHFNKVFIEFFDNLYVVETVETIVEIPGGLDEKRSFGSTTYRVNYLIINNLSRGTVTNTCNTVRSAVLSMLIMFWFDAL